MAGPRIGRPDLRQPLAAVARVERPSADYRKIRPRSSQRVARILASGSPALVTRLDALWSVNERNRGERRGR